MDMKIHISATASETGPTQPEERPVMDQDVISQLAARFRHARRAALRYVVGETTGQESEQELLTRARALDVEAAERRVFDNCLALGHGFRQFYRQGWQLIDLPRVLGQLETPCYDGAFAAPDDRTLLLLRGGCPEAGAGCHHYREALAGLVLGVTGSVLTTRQCSRGAGDDRCIDALHEDPQSPHAHGSIPPEMAPVLEQVARHVKAFDSSAELTFLGIDEGQLLYRLARRGDPTVSLGSVITRSVQRRFPNVSVREASPRPVVE